MKYLTLIAAVAKNGVIGQSGKIPWTIPDDLKRFKKLTLGHPIIMGRKTFESIGKPLPGRYNIVISSKKINCPDLHVVNSLDEAVDLAEMFVKGAYVIGGQRVYEEAIEWANRMELTELNKEYQGDRYFPNFDKTKWNETSRIASDLGDYSFVTYLRK